MTELKEFDKPYINCINKTINQLYKVSKDIERNYVFDLSKTEISEAILERLRTYYVTQGKIKEYLNKRYLTAGSDYFVESVLFFLRLYLQTSDGQLQAHSERQIRKKRNAIRPDISIWNQDEVVAIIECKTQLGWNRLNWEQHFVERESKLKMEFPNAKSFLLVMTGLNWSGFGNHNKLNQNYFCLLNDIWPSHYNNETKIFTPIEGLFQQISFLK